MHGIEIVGFLSQLGPIKAEGFDESQIEQNPFFFPDAGKLEALDEYMRALKKEGNSVGAKVCRGAQRAGGPGGAGVRPPRRRHRPRHDGHQRGERVEIGDGFAVVEQKARASGRDDSGRLCQQSCGGHPGGISSGQEIVVSMALKPTSSITVPGKTITTSGEATEMITKGRHDPCVGIRAVPIAEAMLALVLMDHLLRHRAQNQGVHTQTPQLR